MRLNRMRRLLCCTLLVFCARLATHQTAASTGDDRQVDRPPNVAIINSDDINDAGNKRLPCFDPTPVTKVESAAVRSKMKSLPLFPPNPYSGCHARAHVVYLTLNTNIGKLFKVWLLSGKLVSPAVLGSIGFTSASGGDASWDYHVAVAYVDESRETWVIDTLISPHEPIPVSRWLRSFRIKGLALYVRMAGEMYLFNKSEVPALDDKLCSSTFSMGDLVDLPSLANQLKKPNRAFDIWLAAQLSPPTQAALTNYQGQDSGAVPIQQALLQDFNRISWGDSIYELQRFHGVALRSETQTLMSKNPKGSDLQHLNRLLIADAYPTAVSTNHEFFLARNVLNGGFYSYSGITQQKHRGAVDLAVDAVANFLLEGKAPGCQWSNLVTTPLRLQAEILKGNAPEECKSAMEEFETAYTNWFKFGL